MNVALIFAGGTGQRMNSRSKPKQFLELHGKPILIYTVEYFEKHPDIDAIGIVCLESWQHDLNLLLARYGIEKVKWIAPGGKTGHESIHNGLISMNNDLSDKDIVLIHDGVRPLISEELITANIEQVKKVGNAITVENAVETIVETVSGNRIKKVPSRESMKVAKAPQSFYFSEIYEIYSKAKVDGYVSIDSAQLMSHYGKTLYTVPSTPYNIKITSPSDYYVFRALYEAWENSQIFGI